MKQMTYKYDENGDMIIECEAVYFDVKQTVLIKLSEIPGGNPDALFLREVEAMINRTEFLTKETYDEFTKLYEELKITPPTDRIKPMSKEKINTLTTWYELEMDSPTALAILDREDEFLSGIAVNIIATVGEYARKHLVRDYKIREDAYRGK